MIILINNKFTTTKNAKVSIFTNSFQYGHGVFETLRTYNKIPFKPKEHISRLANSAKQLNLKLKYSKQQILSQLNKVAKKSPHSSQKIKIIATAEDLIIFSQKLTITKTIYKGISLKTVTQKRFFPSAKTLNYLDSYLAHQKAAKQGYYDALLIDENKEVYEGAYSNIFWLEGTTLCTRKDSVLHGITLQTVINNWPHKVKYSNPTLSQLLKKKNIYLTQTTTGVVPITKIDNKTISFSYTPPPKLK
ncbi:MAG: aminotransferase class IV [Candidatus Peregrinibacteria bacterium]